MSEQQKKSRPALLICPLCKSPDIHTEIKGSINFNDPTAKADFELFKGDDAEQGCNNCGWDNDFGMSEESLQPFSDYSILKDYEGENSDTKLFLKDVEGKFGVVLTAYQSEEGTTVSVRLLAHSENGRFSKRESFKLNPENFNGLVFAYSGENGEAEVMFDKHHALTIKAENGCLHRFVVDKRDGEISHEHSLNALY